VGLKIKHVVKMGRPSRRISFVVSSLTISRLGFVHPVISPGRVSLSIEARLGGKCREPHWTASASWPPTGCSRINIRVGRKGGPFIEHVVNLPEDALNVVGGSCFPGSSLFILADRHAYVARRGCAHGRHIPRCVRVIQVQGADVIG
jgi:hypothetical protein